jgi:hypothetical protein
VSELEMSKETIHSCTVDTPGRYSSPDNLLPRIRIHDAQQLVITTASVFWSESSVKQPLLLVSISKRNLVFEEGPYTKLLHRPERLVYAMYQN